MRGLTGDSACAPAPAALPIISEASRLAASFRALAAALAAFAGTPVTGPSGIKQTADAILATIAALAAFAAPPPAVARLDSS